MHSGNRVGENLRPHRLIRLMIALGLLTFCAGQTLAADWPGWLGEQRDGVWSETGILEKFPPGGPKVLWEAEIGGGYAGPAVANGRVYVTDRLLDKGQTDPKNPFNPTKSVGQERVLCFDAATGKEIWKFSYPSKYAISYSCGPRTTPVVHDGKVYTLGAMGDLYCFDAEKGTKLWSRSFTNEYNAQPPGWGFSAHPLLDGDNLICLVARDAVVVAFDRHTGKEKWRSLKMKTAQVGYAPPVIYTINGKRQLVIWHPEAVVGLDLSDGKPLWSHDWLVKANLSVSMPRLVGKNQLFLTSFYNGSRLLEISGAEATARWEAKRVTEQPKQTETLNSIMPTPFIKGEHVYGVCSYGQLRCLEVETGKRVWSDLTATGAGKAPVRWANAFLVANGDRFFLFNEKGELVIARLSPKGYTEIDRAKILEPTGELPEGFIEGRMVVWSHPAFAGKAMFARNDKKIVAVSLAAQ